MSGLPARHHVFEAKGSLVVYLIAVVMGYFVATNGMVESSARKLIGMAYANPTFGKMSALGGLGGWFCVLPAAYFVGSDYGNGFLQGLLFCVAALGGAILAGVIKVPGLSYLISAFTLAVNIGLAILVYVITRS
ncbi:MAG: hypothetical protein V4713_02830 [Pseudomonadota bacterium]